jgi:hypothetical protein
MGGGSVENPCEGMLERRQQKKPQESEEKQNPESKPQRNNWKRWPSPTALSSADRTKVEMPTAALTMISIDARVDPVQRSGI